MQIPPSEILTTARLGRVFNKTTATYKFFWFLAILRIHARTGNLRMSVWEIVIQMVAQAWYPIHFFRLSFGKSDSLFQIVLELQRLTQIPIDASVDKVVEGLKASIDQTKVRQQLRILTLNVPYRFLSPWIDTADNKAMVSRSQLLENNCLYSLHKSADEFCIEINPAWDAYLHSHFGILSDFAFWNLTQFLQTRNPNVPAISSKLTRPETRNSLKKQHLFWDEVIVLGGPVRCIYTGRELQAACFDLDHFMPWSFVAHDLIWNLIPSDGSVNSSKSDRLPDMKIHLPRLAALHQHSLRTALKTDNRFHPDGYNIGINVGEAAGQSVFHVHMHVIPRYRGDVENPKGGVRGVIPAKQKY